MSTREPQDLQTSFEKERQRRIEQARALRRPGVPQAQSSDFDAKYPLYARRMREDEAREQAVKRAQARALFLRTYPGLPLPIELQEPEGGAA